MIKSYIRITTYFLITWSLLKYIWHDSRIVVLIGDIETNPGPKHSFSSNSIKICHWNVNRLSSHMSKKVYLLSAFTSLNKLEIICLSKSSFNSKTSPDDGNLEIPDYNIIRQDHPTNTKRWGVWFIIKTHYLLNVLI